MQLLEYENQMFLDVFQEDGLVILSKGLGIERLLLGLVKVFHDPGNLVLVIGTNSQEEDYFLRELEKEDLLPLPKVISNEYGTNQRHDVYVDGGVCFVTSRILVVDLLTERIPFDRITGIIVYKAHRILESCQEAFILRLYRQKNKMGFIKALSGSPWSFTQGFCHVQRVMRNLFVKKLYLWPRFHAVVKSSLEKKKPEVIELHVTSTPAMVKIQMALLDLTAITVKELKKINPTLDTDDVTVENVVSKSFEKIIKYQLDPVWHELGSKSKRLISDLKTLRVLLSYLTQYDSVTFYSLVKSIRDSVTLNMQISDWLFLDSADTMFLLAKERVFGPDKKGQQEKGKKKDHSFQAELNPKFKALEEILEETKRHGTVLVVVNDDRSAKQIQDFLKDGEVPTLRKLYNRLSKELKRREDPSVKRQKTARLEEKTVTDTVEERLRKIDEKASESISDDEGKILDADSEVANSSVVIFPLRSGNDPFAFKKQLADVCPQVVVLYDAEMGCVRELEVFQAINPHLSLKVYFVIFGGSTDEQRYLTTLRREKEAFEFLIKEKGSMVIPEDRDGKSDDHPDLVRDVSRANETVSTRKGAQATIEQGQQKVLVDIREFRSQLPSLIHQRGIDIEPLTLEVGDYILTPDTCVERKSIFDLIGSLNHGRLYNQARAMCRYYKRPILLIEFDPNKSFSMQGKYFRTSVTSSSHDTIAKLILLTLHFPKLRILWCPSPHTTSEMFELLKLKKAQPIAEEAMKITSQESQDLSEKYNHAAQDYLLQLPGMNIRNVRLVMNKVKDIAELVTLPQKQFAEILGNESSAKALWEGLHQSMKQDTGPGSKTKTARRKK